MRVWWKEVRMACLILQRGLETMARQWKFECELVESWLLPIGGPPNSAPLEREMAISIELEGMRREASIASEKPNIPFTSLREHPPCVPSLAQLP